MHGIGKATRLWSVAALCLALALGAVTSADDTKAPAKDAKEKDQPAKDAKPVLPPASGAVSDDAVIAYINEQIEQGWKDNKITPSDNATPYEFLRRLYLDNLGRIPKVEEISAYLKHSGDKNPRRDEIARVMKDEDFARNWANIWTVWLLTRTSPPGIDREKMRVWLEDCFALNKPYNKMVEELITATGKVNENGAANFVASHVGDRVPADRRARDGMFEMVPVTARTARVFLGQQLQCTQCHNHPFIDSRKQSQYWGINAFFRQVERSPENIMVRRQDTNTQFYTIRDRLDANPDGGVFFEQRNGTLVKTVATYLDGTRPPLSTGVNRRQELAKLIIQDEMFAKSMVNRMWAHYMGRGFTNPVDDFSEQNTPSHPELLDKLAKDFVATGYDLRRLMTWICNSKPYQLTSRANKTNEKPDTDMYFARMQLKAMSPEQLVESIFTATNAEATKATREDRRRMQEEWLRDFTVNFGDDEGNEATFNGTVVQALLLMNGKKLNEAIQAKSGSTVFKAMSKSAEKRLEHIFLAALGRPPSAKEKELAGKMASAPAKDPSVPYQDILWALINSNEFILNH
jgi:hypothetical protein